MTQEHLITPPPELVQQWITPVRVTGSDLHIATRAAQYGADQELEACCTYMQHEDFYRRGTVYGFATELRAARRPKPPSLKEQALAELDEIMEELHDTTGSAFTADAIRRALEQLDD